MISWSQKLESGICPGTVMWSAGIRTARLNGSLLNICATIHHGFCPTDIEFLAPLELGLIFCSRPFVLFLPFLPSLAPALSNELSPHFYAFIHHAFRIL